MSVLLHVPHASTAIPDDVRRAIVLDDAQLEREVLASTDLHTDLVVAGLDAPDPARVRIVRHDVSRLVVDPERFLDVDREPTEQVGRGAVYVRGHDGAVLRDAASPGFAALRDDLLRRFFHPHHAAVERAVTELLDADGTCTILDVHSYPREAQPYELAGGLPPDAPRPPLCIGTDPQHTPEELAALVEAAAAAAGIATARDTPFRGTFVPLAHLGDARVRSVMLEVRRDLLGDEATGVPDAAGVERVRGVVRAVVAALSDRP